MNADRRRRLFERLAAERPDPRPELDYTGDFELLIAVILSAQATDIGVNRATGRLFPIARTPAAMLELGEDGVRECIRTLGLYNAKARNVIATCERLVHEHGGTVPGTRAALEALPGVGRKTAGVVLNIAFGEPTLAVDTHVFRVANRTGLGPGRTPGEVERVLLRRVPRAYLQNAHHWLILHGRYTCTARRPRCGRCTIASLCEFPDKPAGGSGE